MNRRAFLSGLLCTTAAIPLARAAPFRFSGYTSMIDWDFASQNSVSTWWYMHDGRVLFVPQPKWCDDVFDIVEAK
jgi:hypothetical protein